MKIKKQAQEPLISVIMPVYNAQDYVSEAIESIRKQTIKNIEFLIIDDCSTDNSFNILKKYAQKDRYIHLLRNKIHIGLAQSLNKLLPLTKGKYVARMDNDDVSLPFRLEKQVKFLEQNPHIIACGGHTEIINEYGAHVAFKYFPTNPKDCYNFIMNYMVIQPPLLMTYGNIIRKLRYDTHIFGNDDISMHFKLITKGKISNVDKVLFKYRKSSLSPTHRDPRQVYFLALRVRLGAIIYGKYKPALFNFLLTIPESILVLLLPQNTIIWLFELVRHHFVYVRIFHNFLSKYFSSPKVKMTITTYNV